MFAAACADGGGGHDSASAGLSGAFITSATTLTTAESPAEGTTAASTSGLSTSETTAASEPTQTADGAQSSSGTVDGSSTQGGDDGAASGAATTGAGPKFDVGGAPETGDPAPPAAKPCVKVDLLFVIDNSGSMKDEQANLIASFPVFVQEIQQQLADAESLHIGVVTTDEYEFNEAPCNGVLGGLVTATGGKDSSGALCGPYAGGRFMTEQDDLPQRFACAGQVGTDGDGDERPVDAALYALGPGLAAQGACNEGFARDDALLVLVLITDEEEEASVGDPPQWFNTLVALRGGAETNIVVLSLIGTEMPACPDALEVGHRLIEFTSMFTYGSVGQICAASYQTFFHDAVTGIAEACGNFIPPG